MDFGNLIQRLYPFSFEFDRTLRMNRVHDRMRAVIPEAQIGQSIAEVFKLHRPKAEPSWDLLTRSALTSFELVSRTNDVMFRGGTLVIDDSTAWFIGTPNVKDFALLKKYGFRLDDFPPFDTSLDAQLALSGTRSALRDAESLARQLELLNQNKSEQIEKLNRHVVRNAADSGLGRVIASMMHDLNSQFGIAVTGSHMVKDSLDILNEELSRSDPNLDIMRDAMVDINQMQEVVRQSVLRGIEFIGNYKLLSIDHSSGRERDVVLLDYVRQLVDSLRPMFKSKQIRFEVDGDPSIIVDKPGLFSQIVMNLSENAYRHAFHGRTTGTVRFHMTSEAGRNCLIYEDDGVGMSPEVLSRHMDPFFTTKEKDGGSGLGAYSIAVLVREHLGGTLDASSTLGVGTRYDIRF
jgi:signal transduction histidine kinase